MPRKRGTLTCHELGKNLFKEEVLGKILFGKDNVIMEDGRPGDKRGKVF